MFLLKEYCWAFSCLLYVTKECELIDYFSDMSIDWIVIPLKNITKYVFVNYSVIKVFAIEFRLQVDGT